MTTPATDATMSTACCNGLPSPLLQNPIPPIPASASPNRCERIYQTYYDNEDCFSLVQPFKYRPVPAEHTLRTHRQPNFNIGRRKSSSRFRRILSSVVVCFFAVVVSVVISCLLMRFLLSQSSRPEFESDGKKSMKMCVPCSPKKVQESGTESTKDFICCASDEAEMKQLIIEGVRLSLQDRLKGEELYSLLNNPLLPPPINKDAAHVFFRLTRWPKRSKVNFDQSEGDNFEILRDWNSDGDSAFIRSGIEFNSTRGHFRVKNAGIYVIYSRIVYENADVIYDRPDSDVISGRTRLAFGHSIVLYHREQYKALLEDEQTADCDANTVCYNSKIFSTLHLTRDSQIAVRAMQSRFVSSRSHASYFGLYKID